MSILSMVTVKEQLLRLLVPSKTMSLHESGPVTLNRLGKYKLDISSLQWESFTNLFGVTGLLWCNECIVLLHMYSSYGDSQYFV
jgi:hypothetical protein